MNILISINTCILLTLSLLHFYWVFNGKWGIESAIPDTFRANYFNPKNKNKNKVATLIVAFGLIFFAVIISSNYFVSGNNWAIIGTPIVAVIFILRAIGDFNVFGIFKKNSTSRFAKSDSRIFVPLCIYLGISSILITLLKN